MEGRKHRALVSWQTQTLSTFIAAASGAGEDFVKQALAVSLDPQEEKASTKSKEPQTGSYERLMSGLAPGITRPR